MTQIATRWVDRNIDVISKRMKITSREGLRVNFNNKIIDSVRTMVCIGKKRTRGTKSGFISGKTKTFKKGGGKRFEEDK